jgi:signal transduction histidine kinase/ligand-binding sensor domain-containing protein
MSASTASLLLAAALAAPPSELSYRTFTTDNGLPQNSVYAIDQTPDGYLWIATFDGLVRFDGHRMTVFNHAEVPEILSNRILALRVDREGSLWIGTEGGGVARMKDGAVRSFGLADGVPHLDVGAIQEDAEGRVWIATHGGLARFDGARWTVPDEAGAQPGELAELYTVALRRANGMRILEPGGSIVDYVGPTPLGHYQEPRGAYWVRTGERKLTKFHRGQTTTLQAPDAPRNVSKQRFAVLQRRDGRTLLILDGRISVLEKGAWRTFAPDLPAAATEPIAFFEDVEGSLWIGSENGLVQAFTTPVRTIVPDARVQDRNFYPIAEDRSGRVWASTQHVGFRIESERFARLDYTFNSILPEPDGSVLLGGSRLTRNRPDGRAETILDRTQPITDILRDREGALWLGTESGVFRLEPSGAIRRFGSEEGLAGTRVTDLLESARGGVWIGCYGGLTLIDGDRVTSWRPADGLSSDKVRALHEDERGALWIGTYDGGVTRLQGGKLVTIRKRDGLFDDGAFAILDDGMGRLWMSCNRGIYAVSRDHLDAFAEGRGRHVVSRSLGRVDGMLDPECNGGYQPAGFRKSDGTLWFPTRQGIAIVDPRKAVANSVPPNVVIEQVASERRGHTVAPSVVLDPSERRLEVRFTATTFMRPEHARFRYKLEGLEDEWAEGGTARAAHYSHLPPGRYVFHVAASNADGVWNEKGASLAIRVLPAWWQTLWFRGGALTAAIGLVGLGIRSRFARLKRRRAEQDLFSRQLIASQEAERKRIAGELHDGIGQTLVVIRNRAHMGLRDEAELPEARRQIEEILEATGDGIEEVRKVAYNLRPYQLDRLGLTRAIEALVEQAASSSGLTIASRLDPLDGVFPRDDEIGVYRIVQEALSNMLRHAQASRASVEARVADGRVEIAIEDDGRGFDAQALPADRQGMGLSGIAERARILGGRHAVQSSPRRGTRIAVVLPRRDGAS